MPIRIPNNIPAAKELQKENIFYMDDTRAIHQDIRTLEILVLNLMPTKEKTETQLIRLLGNTALQVNVRFLRVSSHESQHTSLEHMERFYHTFDEIRDEYFDGLIITGAPVETLPFEEVDYWDELCRIFEWSKTHVYSTLHICWGAQAGLYYRYGIPKVPLKEKMFGIFPHTVTHKNSILFRGFDDVFMVPHSRHTMNRKEDIEKVKDLKILAESDLAGVYAISTNGGREIYLTGHSEYDVDTLDAEYRRDRAKGLPIQIPYNYYPDDDPEKKPLCTWRSSAHMLYANWLNYFVYQKTPYQIEAIRNGGYDR